MAEFKERIKVKRILVTGEPDDLLPRLPASITAKGEHVQEEVPVEWITIPVLHFKALEVPKMLMTRVFEEPFDWIVFTSARTIEFWDRATGQIDRKIPPKTKVACIGKRTAETARSFSMSVHFFPNQPGTEGFLKAFKNIIQKSSDANASDPIQILIPMAENGRKDLGQQLSHLGCAVTTVPIYQTLPKTKIEPISQQAIEDADLIIFTSPSSADAFIQQVGIPPQQNRVGCLGQYTWEHLKKIGIRSPVILPQGDYERIGEILC